MYAIEGSVYKADGDSLKDASDFSKEVESYLMRSGTAGISAVICAVAVIDHSFESLILKLDQAEASLAMLTNRDPASLGLQQAHLSLPMRRRHWEQACSTWRGLRTTKLTPQTFVIS
jgi:hypothetical protein